jgi:hypothetical protein
MTCRGMVQCSHRLPYGHFPLARAPRPLYCQIARALPALRQHAPDTQGHAPGRRRLQYRPPSTAHQWQDRFALAQGGERGVHGTACQIERAAPRAVTNNSSSTFQARLTPTPETQPRRSRVWGVFYSKRKLRTQTPSDMAARHRKSTCVPEHHTRRSFASGLTRQIVIGWPCAQH